MSPDRFRWCLTQLGWTVARLARYLQIEPGTVRQMRNGRRPVPDNLEAWLEREATAAQSAATGGPPHQITTLPDDWIEWRGHKGRDQE